MGGGGGGEGKRKRKGFLVLELGYRAWLIPRGLMLLHCTNGPCSPVMTSASLKFTVLNPKGRIWTMIAGGGASVIYADTVGDLGYASELGNYAEYSGAPNEEEVLQYARVVIDCATANPDGRKRVLLIGGGIANFTDVAVTFNGIIRALREKESKLKAARMHIYVRSGGPNYQTGLAKMRALGEELGVPLEVFGTEATMTGICKQAIECIMSEMVSRSTSDAPPAHYMIKIQLFSLLTTNNIERYDSGDFEAGGYKWKLALYPSGNKSKGIKDHLSLYLVMAEGSPVHPGWEVQAVFRLFVLNQNKDTYLVLEDTPGKGKRFHRMKLEWGFDQFIPLKTFNNPSNGYLVNDTCVFGAEVFVCKEQNTGKGECLSMVKDAITYKNTWKIDNFSRLDKECYDSKAFSAGDLQWKIQLYPKGKGSGMEAEPSTLPFGSKIFADVALRILDQMKAKHHSGKANYWFSSTRQECGGDRFITLGHFNQPNTGFLVKDSCWVEAEITIHGMANLM
ncbi:unnamed protein product [Camellia sinensis]